MRLSQLQWQPERMVLRKADVYREALRERMARPYSRGRFRGNALDKSETDYIEGLDNLDLGGLTINNPEEV